MLERHMNDGWKAVTERTATGTFHACLQPARACAPTLLLLALSGEDTLCVEPYRCVGQLLYAQGWNVVSLDLPCHGADRRLGEQPELAGWAARIGQGEDIVTACRARANELIEHLVAARTADPQRLAVAGTSRGGYMAFQVAAGNPRIRAVAAFSPVTDLLALTEFDGLEDNSLARQLALVESVTALADRAAWITIGSADLRVGTDKVVAFARALAAVSQERGLASGIALHVVPTPGHSSFPEWHAAAAAWFQEVMAPQAHVLPTAHGLADDSRAVNPPASQIPSGGSQKVLIDDVRLLLPGYGTVRGRVVIDGARIVAAGPRTEVPAEGVVVEGNGRLLTPGLIDMHVHGIERYCFDNGPEEVLAASACFSRFGTTSVLPTLTPRCGNKMLDGLAAVAGVLDRAVGVHLPGLHLEGPFMALPGAGCEAIPGDLGLLEDILAACGGRARVMSLSPDTPNILPVIERLCERQVMPFVTHTRATLEQARAAVAAGARHATHFYDVFPMPPERDPGVRPAGVVELFLAEAETTLDFIADGCHVDPVVIRMAVRAKGSAGVALITDANIGAGLPPGEYATPWGFYVRVEPGNGARIADRGHAFCGALAGSALTMNAGMANLLRWLELPEEQVWAMGTATPARIAGLTDTGTLKAGARADLVLWNEDLTPACVWVGGTRQLDVEKGREK